MGTTIDTRHGVITERLDNPAEFAFTVFTPTFNRAHTLPRVYESLTGQTFRDFEWLIVDDGSHDGTGALVETWRSEQRINVRYIYQENQGKHVAFNRGVAEARGNLFLILDSDDSCTPNSLERLLAAWHDVPLMERSRFSGVTCLCMDRDGRINGTTFPESPMDSDPITLQISYRVRGEKWGFHRTDILRAFPYPVFRGERFIPEGLIWNRIARRYKLRFINEPLRIYEDLPDGLTSQGAAPRVRSPFGARLYYQEYAQFQLPLRHRIKALLNYLRFSSHAGVPALQTIRESGNWLVATALFPIGAILAFRDRANSTRALKSQE